MWGSMLGRSCCDKYRLVLDCILCWRRRGSKGAIAFGLPRMLWNGSLLPLPSGYCPGITWGASGVIGNTGTGAGPLIRRRPQELQNAPKSFDPQPLQNDSWGCLGACPGTPLKHGTERGFTRGLSMFVSKVFSRTARGTLPGVLCPATRGGARD